MRVYRPSSWFALDTLLCSLQTWLTLLVTLFLNSPTPWYSKIYTLWNFLSVTMASLRLLASFQVLLCWRWIWLGGTHQLPPDVMIGMDPERWGSDKNAQIYCSYVIVGETGLSRRIKVSWEHCGKRSSALLLWDPPLPRNSICPCLLSPTGLEQLKSIRTMDLNKTLGFSVASSLLFLPPIRRLMVEGPRQRWENFLSHQPVLIENGME